MCGLLVKKLSTFTLDCGCRDFTCRRTQIPHPLPFHNIMEPVETWDNIWRGNGKDNGRLWTTFIPSRSPPSRVWVAAALLNHVWNFWLQRQHTYVFSRFLCIQFRETRSAWIPGKCLSVTVTHSAQLFLGSNKAAVSRLFLRSQTVEKQILCGKLWQINKPTTLQWGVHGNWAKCTPDLHNKRAEWVRKSRD